MAKRDLLRSRRDQAGPSLAPKSRFRRGRPPPRVAEAGLLLCQAGTRRSLAVLVGWSGSSGVAEVTPVGAWRFRVVTVLGMAAERWLLEALQPPVAAVVARCLCRVGPLKLAAAVRLWL